MFVLPHRLDHEISRNKGVLMLLVHQFETLGQMIIVFPKGLELQAMQWDIIEQVESFRTFRGF